MDFFHTFILSEKTRFGYPFVVPYLVFFVGVFCNAPFFQCVGNVRLRRLFRALAQKNPTARNAPAAAFLGDGGFHPRGNGAVPRSARNEHLPHQRSREAPPQRALGVPAETDGDDIVIRPAPVRGGRVKTYDDHRVAMAFTLIGLKTGTIVIENPQCCKKTFENYFEIISKLTDPMKR